jgi:hypothetical protein
MLESKAARCEAVLPKWLFFLTCVIILIVHVHTVDQPFGIGNYAVDD